MSKFKPLTGILLLAVFVRLIGIDSRPIWYDEAFAILFSSKGPAAMLYGTLTTTGAGAADIHPLGYYILLWLWMEAFGQSIVVVRLLSFLAGILTIPLVYYLMRDLFSERAALAATIFIALSPFHVHYSQEIRMYSFLALWLALATLAFFRVTRTGRLKWWGMFMVSAVLAQYTHNLSAFYLLPLAAIPLIRRDWKNLRAILHAGLGAILLYMPWLMQVPSQVAKISTAYWVERPGFDKLLTLLLVYVTNLPLPNTAVLFAGLFIALAVVSIGVIQTFRVGNRDENAIWLLYLAFMPPLFLFIFSQWIPVYIERALLPSGVIFYTWLAWSLFETRLPAIIRNGLLLLLFIGAGFGLYQHITYRGFPYAPYRELDASLRERIAPGDIILHASKATRLPMAYYDPDLPQEYLADPAGSSIDTLALATQEVLNLTAISDLASATRDAERVWLIVLQTHTDAYKKLGYEDHPYLIKIAEQYRLEIVETWGDIQLHLFIRKTD
ncbi:MAG: glycosyltransferase family 39 protein [Chloroflexi bacterium]|nr:glycosyltransferase family 39 protein [Chloroflexota bacterium]